MTNMTHPPQEILIKVMCSERLPSKVSQFYFVELERGEKHHCLFSTYRKFITPYHYYDVIAWYEPATRVVLTVEEFENIKERYRKLGYLEAREDMDDERDADDLY